MNVNVYLKFDQKLNIPNKTGSLESTRMEMSVKRSYCISNEMKETEKEIDHSIQF